MNQTNPRPDAAIASVAFCESRLHALLQLVDWNIDRPSRPADALILAQGLVGDAYRLILPSTATAEEMPTLAAMRAELAEQAGNRSAAALENCVGLLSRPWRDWNPDRQIRLAEQVADKLNTVVVGLAGPKDEAPVGHAAMARRLRFGLLVAFIAASIAGGYRAYDRVFAPQFYAVRMADLDNIRSALEKYRQRNGSYPVSARNGGDWNGIGWNGPAENWLPGLVPDYLQALPRDPRMTMNPYQQYAYRSDGKDYKLIALVTEDCEFVIGRHPPMSDLSRNIWRLQNRAARADDKTRINVCNSYGYWTENAKDW